MQRHTGLSRHANMGPKSNELSGKLWLTLAKDVGDLGTQRTVGQIMQQWTNMKSRALTIRSERNKAHAQTGNQTIPPPMEPLFERILSVMGVGAGVPLKNAKSGINKSRYTDQSASLGANTNNASPCTSKEINFPGKTLKQKKTDRDLNLKNTSRDQNFGSFIHEAKESTEMLKLIHQELTLIRATQEEKNRLTTIQIAVFAKAHGISVEDDVFIEKSTDKDCQESPGLDDDKDDSDTEENNRKRKIFKPSNSPLKNGQNTTSYQDNNLCCSEIRDNESDFDHYEIERLEDDIDTQLHNDISDTQQTNDINVQEDQENITSLSMNIGEYIQGFKD